MQYSSLESLSLPRRQRVFDTQLVPHGDPLPLWRTLPLDSKLPVVPSPKGSYTLYTTNLGQPKYIHKQRLDFDLGHSLYARPGEYDSLHDPFLKDYFDKPNPRRQLIHNDLITKDGKVKCDVKEFNQYRSYLRYRSVTELSLQRSRDRVEDSWLSPRHVRSEMPRDRHSLHDSTERPRSDKHSLHNSTATSRRDADSSQALAMYGRDVSLVQRMRMREKTIVKRMTEKERQREKDYNRRLKESWQSRKQRQQRLLQHENQIDKKMREERARQLLQREKTLTRQRDRMMAKLGRSTDGLDVRHTDNRKGLDVRHTDNRKREAKRKEGERKDDEKEREATPGEEEEDYASDNA